MLAFVRENRQRFKEIMATDACKKLSKEQMTELVMQAV